MTERIIQSIQFTPGEVSVTWFEVPDSFRESGMSRTHHLSIPFGQEYGDEIDKVMDAAQAMLADALEDFDASEPFDPQPPDDVDEGMGT